MMAELLSVMHNAAQPFGVNDPDLSERSQVRKLDMTATPYRFGDTTKSFAAAREYWLTDAN